MQELTAHHQLSLPVCLLCYALGEGKRIPAWARLNSDSPAH